MMKIKQGFLKFRLSLVYALVKTGNEEQRAEGMTWHYV
jgi:hypothetical protein